jgi:hypothetical protein
MQQQSRFVTFHVTCTEPRAWLVLTSDVQEPSVVEMHRRHPNNWSISADLIPGEYRCRCYSGDDRNVTYQGPAHIDGGTECGMDTSVSVKFPQEKDIPQPVR